MSSARACVSTMTRSPRLKSFGKRQGYWGFNADNYMKYSSTEKWDTIPADKRDTRDTLVSAAGAYLDAFLEQKKDLVPWGYPCVRIEGGMYTGKGTPKDSCDVGVPELV